MALANFYLWGAVFHLDGNLHILFFDIGQGDAIFIETPHHYQILIDGGPSKKLLSKLGGVMWPWDKTIDAILFTHPDADHITGLVYVLENYQVDHIYETGLEGSSQIMQALEKNIKKEPGVHHFIAYPENFMIDGVSFQVVSPDRTYQNKNSSDANATSIVLKVTYGETSVLLTGDATVENEAVYGSRVGDIDVLKVGHHGSRTSTDPSFLDTITPEIAIISVGKNNHYGHPFPSVLGYLKNRFIQIYRTDQNGDILLISNGGEPEVFSAPLPF